MSDERLAGNSVRAYRADWDDFSAWCGRRGFLALPARPETVTLYLTDMVGAGRSRATLQRRLAAIAHRHRQAGQASPSAHALPRSVLAGAREPHAARAPLGMRELRVLTAALPATLLGHRDRALLLIGFGGALRRSELVGLDVERLDFAHDGLIVTLAQGGRRVGIPRWGDAALCPVRAADAWLSAADLADGPVFRPINRHGQLATTRLSDRAVALVVKRAAQAAGVDPTRLAGESLRAGLITRDREGGVDWRLAPRVDAGNAA
jgi:site-specific recombinase XerD